MTPDRPRPVFDRSAAHVERAHRIIPGAAHTYARGDDQYPEHMAPVIACGRGALVWDLDGNELVEYGAGLRSVTLGHCHPVVDEAVTRAMALGSSFVRPHEAELRAAELLQSLVPSAEMVKFGIHGSDVTTAALKLARAATGRRRIAVCVDHPFFSVHDWFIATTPMDAGIVDDRDATIGFHYNDLPALAALFEAHGHELAAIIMEPETSTPPAPGWFDGVRELCDRHGVVFILDEIITGFRFTLGGAQTIHDIHPDLSTFAKGMGNGYPISALCGRAELMRLGGFVDDHDRVFLLSHTYAAQPWMFAAFEAVVEVHRRDDVAARLAEAGARLREGVEQVVAGTPAEGYVFTAGRDCNLVFGTRDRTGAPSQVMRTIFMRGLLNGGVVGPSFVVNLGHTPELIDRTVDAVAAVLPEYGRALEGDADAVLGSRPVRPALRRRG